MEKPKPYRHLIESIYECLDNPLLWERLLQWLKHEINVIEHSDCCHASEKKTVVPIPSNHKFHRQIKRVAGTCTRIAKSESVNAVAFSAIEQMPIGVVITTVGGMVHFINTQAENICKQVPELVLRKGEHIHHMNRIHSLRLQHMLSPTHQGSVDIDKESQFANWTITMPSTDANTNVTLLVIPISTLPAESEQAYQAGHCIFISNPGFNSILSESLLRLLYSLTHAEARLANQLVKLGAVDQVAAELNISINTARTQLKSIYRKTGTTRQSELLFQLLTSVANYVDVESNDQKNTPPSSMNDVVSFRDKRVLGLSDNRELYYYDIGSKRGKPVLFCHGFLSPDLELSLCPDFGKESGIRWIVPFRPGYGGSSIKENSTTSDWINDITQLLNKLDIDTFSVLGFSIGSLYAVNLASKLPTKIVSIKLLSAVGDAQTLCCSPQASLVSRLGGLLVLNFPELFKRLIYKYQDETGVTLKELLPFLPIQDADYIKQNLATQLTDRLSTKGAMIDFDYWVRTKPLKEAELTTSCVAWHCIEDPLSPLAHSLSLFKPLMHQPTYQLNGEGHYAILRYWPQIVEELQDCESYQMGQTDGRH